MKRFVIGLALLIALLGAGIGVQFAVQRLTDSLCRELDAAGAALIAGDTAAAADYAAGAEARWLEKRVFFAALSDHARLEEITGGFSRLRNFTAAEDPGEAEALCAELIIRLRQLGEDQSFCWESFL